MRSYKAARRAKLREPITFEVDYIEEGSDGEETERTMVFECKGKLSALTLSEFASSAEISADTPEGARALRDVLSSMFGDALEYRRFSNFAATYLEDDQLVDIVGDLIEEFTGRPTERPESSPSSQSATGQGSKVVSLPGGFSTQAEPEISSTSTAANS